MYSNKTDYMRSGFATPVSLPPRKYTDSVISPHQTSYNPPLIPEYAFATVKQRCNPDYSGMEDKFNADKALYTSNESGSESACFALST